MLRRVIVLAVFLSAEVAIAREGPHYGGGHHTYRHGRHYVGGSGSSHGGGYYVSRTGSHHYGCHKC